MITEDQFNELRSGSVVLGNQGEEWLTMHVNVGKLGPGQNEVCLKGPSGAVFHVHMINGQIYDSATNLEVFALNGDGVRVAETVQT